MSNQASLGDISNSGSADRKSENSGDDWTSEKIGDIFEGIKSGGTPKRGKDKYWEDGEIPFVKIEDLNRQQGDGISDAKEYTTQQAIEDGKTRIYDPGTILLTIYGTLGETGIVTESVSTNQGIIGLWDPKDTNIQFARYALDFEQDRLASKKRETTQANIGKNILKLHEIPHPPKDEQRRIASVLYNVDQAISKTEEIIEQTQRVKKGLMQDLFTEGYYSHEEYQETRLGKIPANWDMIPAKELCEEITVGIVSGATDHYCGKEGVPFVRNQDITPTGIEAEEPKFISEEFHEQNKKSELKEGDVVTVRTGQPGTSCVVGKEYEGANSFSTIISRPKDSTNEKYYSKFVNSDKALQFIDSWKAGGVQDNFNIGVMRKLPVPYPPEDEQEKIVESVEAVQEKIQSHKEEKEQLQRLKKGLMQDLLTGSVRTGEDVRVLDEVVEVEG